MSIEVSVGRVTNLQDEEVVDHVSHTLIESGGNAPVVVELGDGTIHRLRRSDPNFDLWDPFLRSRLSSGEPVYIETDRATREVQQILAPSLNYVRAIKNQPVDDQLEIVLILSPSAHYLNLHHPRFKELLGQLEDAVKTGAAVLVTSDPITREIVDVRERPPKSDDSQLPLPNGQVIETVPHNIEAPEIIHQVSVISVSRALDEFQYLGGQRQIPFDFPADCCTARAHEMCRLLNERGLTPEKVFNYGHGFEDNEYTLLFRTNNVPKGFVKWLYHVAPVLEVRQSNSNHIPMVFDPSMFTRPVTIQHWQREQNDEFATALPADASVAFQFPNGATIFTTYAENDAKLEEHRLKRDALKRHLILNQ
jgi:hypothetical protein